MGRHLKDLQDMGLTYHEAAVYSELVALGPSTARRISQHTHLPREDLYHTLKHLESKGLVAVVPDRPSIFAAVEPRVAVRSFVSKLEKRAEELKERAYDLGVWLESLRATIEKEDRQVNHEPTIKAVYGSDAFVSETERAVSLCKSEFAAIVPGLSFKNAQRLGLVDTLVSASKRGLNVRVITETSSSNIELFRKYSKLITIKSSSEAGQVMRFALFDSSRAHLWLGVPATGSEEVRVVFSNSPALVRGLKSYFEQMWSGAQTVN